MTLVVAGLVAAGIAAWGVYSPNKVASDAAVFTANVSASHSHSPMAWIFLGLVVEARAQYKNNHSIIITRSQSDE